MGIDGTAIIIEVDHIPLSQRRKLLQKNDGNSDSGDSNSEFVEDECRNALMVPVDAVVKKEYGDCNLQVTRPRVQTDARGSEKTSLQFSSLTRCPTRCDVPATRNAGDAEILLSSVNSGRKTSLQLDFPAVKVKNEISDEIVDDLDHIVLKERQRMLLARKFQELSNQAFGGGTGFLLENITKHTVEKVKEEIYSADGKTTVARDQCYDIPEGNNTSMFDLTPVATAGSTLSTDYTAKTIISAGFQENDHISISGANIKQYDSHKEHGVVPIKNDGPSSSNCPPSVKVKDEPWDNSEFHVANQDATGSITIKLPNVKTERDVHNEYHDDQVEHLSLVDRLNCLMPGEDSSLHTSMAYSSLKKTRPSAFEYSSTVSEYPEPLSIKRLRKRKKTATDSVQTALEEDAPGLLQVLLDKGVLVDEIKLYGGTENDEALDESFCEDSFSELEAVMSKLFFQRHSFLKLPAIRAAKASRANYCLACLSSLVEQTRYLQFRKWPVEWGWCRDLQSFIFVFERHKRIVLERPEYGYATYFFELVESLPVEWQIRRLVTAMKLTTCSRISLIENKELSIGEDLTEREAKVLMEYGWKPNSGLGTMLNFCDRVVHDRKNEDSSEWRSKIGKLLMDGYNGGTILTPDIPKKVMEYSSSQSPNMCD